MRHFQPGVGPSKGLLCDCKTSNFAKVRLQLYLTRCVLHNCCVFELNVAGATLLQEADVDSLLGNAKVRIKYQEVCGNFI